MINPGNSPYPSPLRILVLEDQPNDAELEIAVLEEACFECQWERVDTRADFITQLNSKNYDLILSDYKLPDYDGLAALQHIQQTRINIPFILVSGTLGEEAAIDGLKAGATDYVLKNRLSRLVPVVQRALIEHAEQKKRRSIEQERSRLLAAVEQAADIILMTDTEGHIQYVNPAFTQITGYTREEVLNKNPRILRSGKQDHAFYRQMWQTISNGQNWRGILINRKKNGSLYTEEATISPVRDTHGLIINYVAVKHDITARKKAEEDLLQAKETAEVANRAKNLFLANMSHELRTPLNPIMGFADLLLKDKNLTDDQRESLELISRRSRDLLQLLSDILDIAKIEADRIILQPEKVNVRHLIEDIVNMFEHQTAEKNIKISIQPNNQLNAVIVDPARLRQILLNLIGNAVEFTDQGEITVTAHLKPPPQETHPSPKERILHLSVRDTGCGIPTEQQTLIFSAFHQADNSSTRLHGGAGLGLSICKRLTDLMNGSISVESSPGKGACFYVQLRVQTPEPLVQTAEPTIDSIDSDTAAPRPPHRSLRILIVEDDIDSILYLQYLLEKDNHVITHVTNGQEAVDICTEQSFDLILMDIKMPVMDGISATQIIRKQEQQTGKHTPIIATTAYAFEEDRKACLAAGMDDWISKPVTAESLIKLYRYIK